MAHIKPNYNKAGQIISYRFFAYSGLDDNTGKEKLVSKTVKAPIGLSASKALKKMQTEADVWERELKKGNVPDQRYTFKHFIEKQFIPVFVCNGKHSPSTIKFYKDICEKLVARFGHKKLDSVRSIDIESFLVDLTKEKYKRGKKGQEQTYAATYINQFRKVLTVAFNFAEKHSLIEKNPVRYISPVKRDRSEVDFLSQDEAKRFLSILNDYAPLYWKTAMNLLIRCGLRRGELAGLKWSDINENNCTLTVCRNVINNSETNHRNITKETKSSNSDRTLPLDPIMMKMLKDWRAEQSAMFGAVLLPSAYILGTVSVSYCDIDRKINREELYDMVWSRPVSQVAKELNISDIAVRKRCIRLNIPMPERGYWSKRNNGKETEIPVLPEYDKSSNYADPYSPIRPDNITQWLARFNKTHGLREVSPHDLRHTCATLLLSNGANIKETQTILGHADASTTLKFYVGTDMNALKSASDRLAQALAMGE